VSFYHTFEISIYRHKEEQSQDSYWLLEKTKGKMEFDRMGLQSKGYFCEHGNEYSGSKKGGEFRI
jgi:hypothetical protein